MGIKKLNTLKIGVNERFEKKESLMYLKALMDPKQANVAIVLQLENLVLTYGFEAVRKGLDKIKINIK